MIAKFASLEEIDTDDIDPDEAIYVADTLRRISTRASVGLEPSVAVLADRLAAIANYMSDGGGDSVDIGDVQAAGFDITSTCQKYPDAVAGN